MKDYIEKRVVDVANYLVDTNATIRNAAKVFGISKTTAHKDIRERLPQLNITLSQRAVLVIDQHIKERAIKGGNATGIKYKMLRGEI